MRTKDIVERQVVGHNCYLGQLSLSYMDPICRVGVCCDSGVRLEAALGLLICLYGQQINRNLHAVVRVWIQLPNRSSKSPAPFDTIQHAPGRSGEVPPMHPVRRVAPPRWRGRTPGRGFRGHRDGQPDAPGVHTGLGRVFGDLSDFPRPGPWRPPPAWIRAL